MSVEHIDGFVPPDRSEVPVEPEKLREQGFQPVDVVCWTNQKGVLVFQHGFEFLPLQTR